MNKYLIANLFFLIYCNLLFYSWNVTLFRLLVRLEITRIARQALPIHPLVRFSALIRHNGDTNNWH